MKQETNPVRKDSPRCQTTLLPSNQGKWTVLACITGFKCCWELCVLINELGFIVIALMTSLYM